jgi:acetyltransferase
MATLLPFAFDWTHLLPFNLGTPAPRPGEIRDTWRARNGATVTLRATREDDAGLIQELVGSLSLKSRYQRFFYAVHELPPETLYRFTRNNPHESMNLIAVIQCDGHEMPVAMAQYATDGNPGRAEFAVVVADEWQREGLGRRLVETLACIARAAGVACLEGDILADNEVMQRMMLKMGFELEMHPEDASLYRAVKMLLPAPEKRCSSLAALAMQSGVGRPAVAGL